MSEVFISYSRKDEEFTKNLYMKDLIQQEINNSMLIPVSDNFFRGIKPV